MSFSFYTEPQLVLRDRQAHNVIVGLGEDDSNEFAFINVGDGYRNDGDVLLAADELAEVIHRLTEIYNSMEAAA